MKNFWKTSEEWQRKEAAIEALEVAREKERKAGNSVLNAVYCYGPEAADLERERRLIYIEARTEADAAFGIWLAADEAFEASPAGRARRDFLADPIAKEGTRPGPVRAVLASLDAVVVKETA
jgi:hypothetical protein